MASCLAPLLHPLGVFHWLSESKCRWQASSFSCMLGRLVTSALCCLYSCSAAVGAAGAAGVFVLPELAGPAAGAAEDAVGSAAAAEAEAAAVIAATDDPRTAAAASAIAADAGAGGAAEQSDDTAGTGAAAAKSLFDAAAAVVTSSTGSTALVLGAWSGAGCGPSDCCLLRCKWKHPNRSVRPVQNQGERQQQHLQDHTQPAAGHESLPWKPCGCSGRA